MKRPHAIAIAIAIAAGMLLGGRAHSRPAPAPLIVYSAGSMTGALGAMLKRYTATTGQRVDLHTGPAGLLLRRIEAGDTADVFVSANMAHPERLTAEGKATATVVFAHNRICVSARHEVGLTSLNLLDKLLDPKVRIGTSTPGADPGGDYAWELFDKAGAVRAGATAMLKAKARPIVGGKVLPAATKTSADGKEFMAQHDIDVSIGYCSSHETTPDTSVDHVELPADLAIRVDYGMTVLTTSPSAARREAADRLALYLMSPVAQAMMAPFGFTPVAPIAITPLVAPGVSYAG
jgi:molybdenum ABC transporter molybdate-binding protein